MDTPDPLPLDRAFVERVRSLYDRRFLRSIAAEIFDGPFACRMIMVGNAASREAERAAQERLRAAFDARLADRLARELRVVAGNAVDGFTRGGRAGAMAAVQAAERNVAFLLIGHWTAVMTAFGERMRQAQRAWVLRDTRDTADDIARAAQAWIQAHVAQSVRGIQVETARAITGAIERGQAEGLSFSATAKLIREKVSADIGFNRALRIARTETHAAAMAAQDQVVQILNPGRVERVWITAAQGARPAHMAANGQRRGLKESFDVGGEKLRTPGDPQASAGNRVNCRCVVGYVQPGSA